MKIFLIHQQLQNRYYSLPQSNKLFLRILAIIALASLLFFILIIFTMIMLIKTHRFRLSSSSFARSASIITSNDYPNDIYHFKSQTYDYSQHYYPTFIPGLVPQTNLSPRFYRSAYQGFNERRIPVHIQSPIITHLQNGDVLISA